MGPYRHLSSHGSPTSELWRITSPSENVKLQMPVAVGVRVLLPELNVQSFHMFTMNLQLLHSQLHSIGCAKYSNPVKNFANNF